MYETLVQMDRRTAKRISQGVECSSEERELDPTNLLLGDYYRCPTGKVSFRVNGNFAKRPGYFRLGQDTICYGQLSSGNAAQSPAGNLDDALDGVGMDANGIALPFDAGMVIENLCRERYTAHFRQEGRVLNEILRKAYYLIRPLLGVSARRQIQKIRGRGWREIRFPAWPVDTTVERIHQKLLALSLKAQRLERIPFIWFWPDGFSSCAIMTHDVEGESGRDFCDDLMDLDESFGIRSSFQVVPENRYSVPTSFLDSIRIRGFEVNVHDLKHDGRLYADHAEFLRRAKRINNYAREYGAEGFRSGILYRNADWYDAFEFSYDMSIPNVAHLDPQLGGCCTVMPYFIGDIVELPVTCTQDYTLFHILDDYSTELWREQIAFIRDEHGLINFIVHPDYIMEPRRAGYLQDFTRSFGEVAGGGWHLDPIAQGRRRMVESRSKMELVYDRRWMARGRTRQRAGMRGLCVCGRRRSDLLPGGVRKLLVATRGPFLTGAPMRSSEAPLTQDLTPIHEFQPLTDPRWGDFLQRHPCSSIFHSVEWLEALHRTYGYDPIAITTSPRYRFTERSGILSHRELADGTASVFRFPSPTIAISWQTPSLT